MSTKLAALNRAKAEIEAHKEHRRAEKIAGMVARGEAVLVPDPVAVITGSPCRKKVEAALSERDSLGREIFYEEGPTVILTGVPRGGPCVGCDGKCVVTAEPAY